MNSRERILAKIKSTRETRNLNVKKTVRPVGSGLELAEGNLADIFKTQLEAVDGKCYIVDNKSETLDIINQLALTNKDQDNIKVSPSVTGLIPELKNTNSDNKTLTIGISTCEVLVAQSGTSIVSANEGRQIIGLSPIHVIIAKASQLRQTLEEGLREVNSKYTESYPSQLTLITGPSRTADIEKTLILGAHGPKQLHVIIFKE